MEKYNKIWDDCYNIQAIAERLREEAEDVKSFADMLQAEVEAYYTFKQEHNVYELNMWEWVTTRKDTDFAYIGGAAMTKEDADSCHFREIYAISYIDEGYRVEYKLGDYIDVSHPNA